jgi:hypothetical protein
MRFGPSLLVLVVASSSAHAENGLSLELGYLRNRVAVTDQTVLGGEAVRFTIKVSNGPHFHWGAVAEEGRLSGSTTLPGGAVARSTGEPQASPLEGNTLGLKLFAGAHTTAGRLMFSSDLAGGMRDTWVSSDLGTDVAGRKKAALVELRARADVWLSSMTTIGAVATADLLERRDVSVGLVFALHFTR